MRGLVAIAVLLASLTPTAAAERRYPIDELIKIEMQANTQCRGGNGDAETTNEFCDIREQLISVLNYLGQCYGKQGQTGAQMMWHQCGRYSIR